MVDDRQTTIAELGAMPDGPERRGAEEVIGKLRQLGRWFGSLIEEGD